MRDYQQYVTMRTKVISDKSRITEFIKNENTKHLIYAETQANTDLSES